MKLILTVYTPTVREFMAHAFVNWLERHPRVAFVAFTTMLLAGTLGGFEIYLRLSVHYNPGYYMAYAKPQPGAVLHYPYGVIHYNSDGFPDDEFDAVKTRPRVAYLGDSVCYGVGAGAGYRVSELLEKDFREWEHMNMSVGLSGAGVTRGTIPHFLGWADRFDLDAIVYLMNLNDVLPDGGAAPVDSLSRRGLGLSRMLDGLRGRSYLYTSLRLTVKNYYVRQGYDATSQRAYELFPHRYASVFAATAARIDELATALAARGVRFQVWILPYEMQVCDDAARAYAGHGVRWEDGFIDRGPQRELLADLHTATPLDLFGAFVRPGHEAEDRAACRAGELFVYDAGDKLDWNHPNRSGHARIAAYVATQDEGRRLFSAP